MRVIQYNRSKAVAYAHKWAYGRNPAYYDFNGIGGDCTNFASQVLFSGSGVMNYTPVYGWYYSGLNSRSPSWTGVPFLYNFLVGNTGPGPFGSDADVSRVQPGDVVQLSFDGVTFGHTPVIVAVGARPATGNIRVAAHTFNADDRPLHSYTYQKLRFIHIEGVRA
ncbi:MAG: amidase domain-containing protein [Clostridiales bacterium]|jgi:hypothetical protein|nr:amidase domain-containing protein [Clostridiales bacterium]